MIARNILLKDSILSVVIVTENDEDIIEERLKTIKKILDGLRINYEILIVDNNSSDDTINKIKNLRRVMSYTRILVLSKKYATEIALTAGLDNCIGDYAILFNLYTDPPEIKSLLLDKLLEGNDIVIGKINNNFKKQNIITQNFLLLIEKLSTQGFSYRQNFLTGLNRKAINSMTRIRRKSRNFSYISSLIGLKKHEISYLPIKDYKHKLKEESFIEIFFSIIDTVISNSFRPIRILSLTGMFFSAIFLLYVFIIVILVVVFGFKQIAPQGWISVSTVMGTMFFLLFSLLTLISEYVVRILNESRDEPFYFVSEEINQSVILPKRRTLNII